MDQELFRERPLMVAIAGPNGAGKSTFYASYLASSNLPFINADVIARERDISAYEAADQAKQARQDALARGESFIFETVFSDPVQEKVRFLRSAADAGYAVALCFIGICDASLSRTRVRMRVLQGGHDVPTEKLAPRFARSLENLKRSIEILPHVFIYDNTDLQNPYRLAAHFRGGQLIERAETMPTWLSGLDI